MSASQRCPAWQRPNPQARHSKWAGMPPCIRRSRSGSGSDRCRAVDLGPDQVVLQVDDVGLLGGPNLLVGDLSGGFRLKIHDYDEYPIVKALGLEVEEKRSDEHETSLSLLKPTMPFWL